MSFSPVWSRLGTFVPVGGGCGWPKLHHTNAAKSHACSRTLVLPSSPPSPAVTQPHTPPSSSPRVKCAPSIPRVVAVVLQLLSRENVRKYFDPPLVFFRQNLEVFPPPCRATTLFSPSSRRSTALLRCFHPSTDSAATAGALKNPAPARISDAEPKPLRSLDTSRRKCARRSQPPHRSSSHRGRRGSPRPRPPATTPAAQAVPAPACAWRRRRPPPVRRRSGRSRARRRRRLTLGRSSPGGITGTRSPSSRTSTPAAPPRSSSSTATSSSGRTPGPASGSRSTTAAPTALPRSRYGDPIPASSVSYLISKSLSEANIFF